jgi:hypothetical protein
MVASQVFEMRRALLLPVADGVAGLGILPEDTILRSEDELDNFLKQSQGAAA